MFRSSREPSFRSGRGTSSRSNKSDDTLLTPLLDDSSDSGSDDSDDSSTAASYDGVPEEKPSALQLAKIAVVNFVLLGGVAASVATMIPGALLLSPSILVYVMGGITIANVPYAAFKEVRMAKIPTIRTLNNRLRDEAHRLEGEVDTLSEEIDAIAPEAERASAVEEELREIADRQQFNVDKLIDLVNENEEVLDQMRENLRSKIVQDIIHIVIKSDVNNDQKFCKVESKMLALKIRIQLQEYGVEFDEMKFYKVMNVNPTVPGVIAIVQKLIPGVMRDDESAASSGDDEDEDSDDYDMFRLTSDKSMRMSGSLVDVPESRRASSALVKCSSWRGALGTSVGESDAAGGPRPREMSATQKEMSATQQVTLALSTCPIRRKFQKQKSPSRSKQYLS
mmetsp:Transcript_27489/g.46722  ORF Transcript_27489/g.46722 Transcript_27489/m.46722 type:complete len:395 (-) Transcript_27489:367-1551(-)